MVIYWTALAVTHFEILYISAALAAILETNASFCGATAQFGAAEGDPKPHRTEEKMNRFDFYPNLIYCLNASERHRPNALILASDQPKFAAKVADPIRKLWDV